MAGHENVRPDTAKRVLAAVEELGYRLHGAAASLASGRTRLLGVILVSNDRYSAAALGVGIEHAAAECGYTVTSATVPEQSSSEAIFDAFDRLERQGVEGVILSVPVDLESSGMRARTSRTPTVHSWINTLNTQSNRAVIDQVKISTLAVEHLLDLGHETVWHVSGSGSWRETGQRRSGWEQSLRARGIEPPPEIVADWTPESGYRAGRTIAAIPDVTAVFVSSDEMAFGLIRALHEAGRRVPEDVSVVSVDDIPLAAYASPALTTVKQPFAQMGRAFALSLIAQIEGESWEHASAHDYPVIEPTLVVRASSAPPASIRTDGAT